MDYKIIFFLLGIIEKKYLILILLSLFVCMVVVFEFSCFVLVVVLVLVSGFCQRLFLSEDGNRVKLLGILVAWRAGMIWNVGKCVFIKMGLFWFLVFLKVKKMEDFVGG